MEVVGIVGNNVAGKSTLLKILSRITEPTSGRFGMRGRVGSLLEIGTGFHPELTGRENIFLAGTILGMRRNEVSSQFDEIVEFAEIARFLDTPVKRYSSGMRVRLGFAVAAHLDPEILVIDEVLAVGDIGFQNKCLKKMGNIASSGRTILFVSHNTAAVRSLCTTGVLLDQGEVAFIGSTSKTLEKYQASIASLQSIPVDQRKDRSGSGEVRISHLTIGGDNDGAVTTGLPCIFSIEFETSRRFIRDELHFAITIVDANGTLLFTCASLHRGAQFPEFSSTGIVRCTIAQLPLVPGEYSVNVACTVRKQRADRVENAATFTVLENDYFGTGRLPKPDKHGPIIVSNEWDGASHP